MKYRLFYRAQQERRLSLIEKPMSEAAFSQPGDAICNSTSALGDSQEGDCVARYRQRRVEENYRKEIGSFLLNSLPSEGIPGD
jgi:hypothetical protein